MPQNTENNLQKKLRQWSALAALLVVILLGLLLPNRDVVALGLFGLWHKSMPLWAALSLALLLGAGLGLTIPSSLWWKERLRRFRSEAEQKQLGQELNSLRKLLANDKNNNKDQ